MGPNKPQLTRNETVDARDESVRANKSIIKNNNPSHPVVKAAIQRNTVEGKVRKAVDTGLTVNEADRRFKAAKNSSERHAATIPVKGGAIRRARNGESMDLIIGVNPDRNK
jgi:hypothetical protein